MPEYDIPLINKKQPKQSIAVFGTKIMIIMLVLVIPAIYVNIKIAVGISVILFILIFVIYFIKKVVILDKYICVVNGIFLKRMQIIKYENIENIILREGIISNKLGICKIYMSILGTLKNSKISSGYIRKKDANVILSKIFT